MADDPTAWKPAACADCGAPWPTFSLTGPAGPWRCMACNTTAAPVTPPDPPPAAPATPPGLLL